MGISSTNYRHRLDITYILYHAQKPLVSTRTSKYSHIQEMSYGEELVVAIACYTGYNMEDSCIMNKESIDRGVFRSSSWKKYDSVIQKNQTTSEDDIFAKPDPSKVTAMRHSTYDKLNEKGYVPEETKAYNDDVILSKLSPIQQVGTTGKVYKDNSITYQSNEPGVIDRVYLGIYNHDGYEMRKVTTRSERVPHVGDKVASQHAQKNTIGLIMNPSDMPITKDGIVPDIIINPSAFPGRMTVGQLIESLVGKAAVVRGRVADGTPFEN